MSTSENMTPQARKPLYGIKNESHLSVSYRQLVRTESQTREMSRLLALSQPQKTGSNGCVETARAPSRELVEALAPLAAVDVENILKAILNNDALDKKIKREYVAEIVMAQPYHSYVFSGYDEHNADVIARRKWAITSTLKVDLTKVLGGIVLMGLLMSLSRVVPGAFSIIPIVLALFLALPIAFQAGKLAIVEAGRLKLKPQKRKVHESHRVVYDHVKNTAIENRAPQPHDPPELTEFLHLPDVDKRRFLENVDDKTLARMTSRMSISRIEDFIDSIPDRTVNGSHFRKRIIESSPFADLIFLYSFEKSKNDPVAQQIVLASNYFDLEELDDDNTLLTPGTTHSPSTMKPVSTLSIESVRADYEDAMKRISGYETDINKALKYPAFNDISTPAVKDMVRQMRTCRRMLSASNEHTVSEIAAAVDDLWVEVHSAEKAAENLSWSSMTDEEKADLELAQQLIAQAQDSGNTEPMRATFYAKLNEVIHRLNKQRTVVPAPVVGEIEHRARKMLTATANGGDVVNAVDAEKVDERV